MFKNVKNNVELIFILTSTPRPDFSQTSDKWGSTCDNHHHRLENNCFEKKKFCQRKNFISGRCNDSKLELEFPTPLQEREKLTSCCKISRITSSSCIALGDPTLVEPDPNWEKSWITLFNIPRQFFSIPFIFKVSFVRSYFPTFHEITIIICIKFS